MVSECFYSSDKSSLILTYVLYLVFRLQNNAAVGKGGAQISLLQPFHLPVIVRVEARSKD